MTDKNKTQEKLLASMRKTKEGVKENDAPVAPKASEAAPKAAPKAKAKPKATKKPAAEETALAFLPTKRVWPD